MTATIDHDNPRSPRSIATAVFVAVALWLVVMAAGCESAKKAEASEREAKREALVSKPRCERGQAGWSVWVFSSLDGTQCGGGVPFKFLDDAVAFAKHDIAVGYYDEAIVSFDDGEWSDDVFKSTRRYTRDGSPSWQPFRRETEDIARQFAVATIYLRPTPAESATHSAIAGVNQ